MIKLLATTHKEILLLWRDKAGLLVLFLMPAVLVVIISLVQENVLKIMGETGSRAWFVDLDEQELGRDIEEKLKKSGAFEIIKNSEDQTIDEKTVIRAVNRGDFQFGIIIPEGFTKTVHKRSRQQIRETLQFSDLPKGKTIDIPEILVYFDPAVRGSFRYSVITALNQVVFGIEIEHKMKIFLELFPEKIKNDLEDVMGPYVSTELFEPLSQIELNISDDRLLQVTENSASQQAFQKTPTSVQQNVPAWSLFGVFFIAIPMAGALIKERQDGTLSRLLTMPVSYPTLMTGKVIASVCVCLVQFSVIVMMGKFLLPLLGTPMLVLGSAKPALLIVALSASLAATGYGIMLGTLSQTYRQASMFGPISIVIAAAIGGIMLPVYAMPKLMQKLSVLSPLEWGQDAFLDIFVRGGDLSSVYSDVLLLLVLFVAMMTVSWIFLISRIHNA